MRFDNADWDFSNRFGAPPQPAQVVEVWLDSLRGFLTLNGDSEALKKALSTRKIRAIKAVRAITGKGLKESQSIVLDSIMGNPQLIALIEPWHTGHILIIKLQEQACVRLESIDRTLKHVPMEPGWHRVTL